IYEDQKTDGILNLHFKNLLVFVYQHLVSEANNSLISEYAKRESSWKKLKDTSYPENLKISVKDYLISEEERDKREHEQEIDTNNIEDTVFLISEIQKVGFKFWDGFRIHINNNKLEDFDWGIAFDLVNKLKINKNLASKEITFGKKVVDYLQENPLFLEDIRQLSKFEEA